MGADEDAPEVAMGESFEGLGHRAPSGIIMLVRSLEPSATVGSGREVVDHLLPVTVLGVLVGAGGTEVRREGVRFELDAGLFEGLPDGTLDGRLLRFEVALGWRPGAVPRIPQEQELRSRATASVLGLSIEDHAGCKNRILGTLSLRVPRHPPILAPGSPAGPHGRRSLGSTVTLTAMGDLSSDARTEVAILRDRREAGPDAVVLDLQLAAPLAPFRPGRFAMLSRADGCGPTVARPLSIYDQTAPDRVSFLLQVVGEGTRGLAELSPGEGVRVTLPLGNGFRPGNSSESLVCVAGGVGSAPFLLLARERDEAGAAASTFLILGARSAELLYDLASFQSLGVQLLPATDDGSLGFHGHAVAAMLDRLERGSIPADARFCACGPEPMLRGFADAARARNLRAEVSLETYMGCGIGVCNACPTPTAPNGPLGDWPYAKVCTDGPVFPLDAIA